MGTSVVVYEIENAFIVNVEDKSYSCANLAQVIKKLKEIYKKPDEDEVPF